MLFAVWYETYISLLFLYIDFLENTGETNNSMNSLFASVVFNQVIQLSIEVRECFISGGVYLTNFTKEWRYL